MGARIAVGGVFTHSIGNGSAEVDFLVMATEAGKTMRFKKDTPGWRLLVLDVRGASWWALKPGETFFAPLGSSIVRGLTRLA